MAASHEMMREFTTHSAEETIALGATIASSLVRGSLYLLRGDLGAGKTTLVKGIAESMRTASADEVTSPTFTLVHEYRGREITIYHLDLYRIESERELFTVGVDDLISPAAILLIEWGEKFSSVSEAAAGEIIIDTITPQDRRITLHIFGEE